ncbi:MAG: amidohydrolase [Deltaproteobacteria bacterium]|nr:amidohydrolase [Deltaproteobacteria bacterium]
MITVDEIKEKTYAIREELIALRRHLHRHPELGNKEIQTSELLRKHLSGMNLEVKTGLAVTGITALLRGGAPGRTIGIRSDMDALPIQDKKKTSYRSEVPGVMHACGHDLHMATLIGAARVLSQFQDRLPGNVKFIFQPCEERVLGADRMIAAGVLDNPPVSVMLGFHSYPLLPTGVIGIKQGVMMASADLFSIHLYGKAGHAAKPHLAVDAIAIAAMVIHALHLIVSSRIDPVHPALVSIGMIRGGTAENIVCDHVELRGTIRTTSNKTRKLIFEKIEKKVRGITEGMEGRYRLNIDRGSPLLNNHPVITRIVEECATEILGPERVQSLTEPSLGGEDFSSYIEKVPGTYFRIGTGNPAKDTCHYLHSDLFDVDETAIPEAVQVLCWSVLRLLQTNDLEE